MAKKNLTLDEKLEEAIVKDGAYEVPGNWVWSKLGYIVELKSGSSIPDNLNNLDGAYLYVKVGDMNLPENSIEITDSSFRVSDIIEFESKIIPNNSIIFPKRGGAISTNKKRKVMFPILVDTNTMAIIVPDKLNYNYIYYWFLSIDLWTLNNGSSIPQINNKDIEPLLVPIPPLKEQQRIVNRIESLFEKLDKAKELIEEAREGLEKRKASITSKAFRGTLNKRKGKLDINNSCINETIYEVPDNWRWLKLEDVCDKITDGTHNSPQSYETGDYKYITAKNIKEWGIDLSNVTYLTKEDHDIIYKRCDVKYGDVLYIKDGATAGIATINELDEEFSLLSSVALLRASRHIDKKYLCYVLNSFEIKKLILESVKGVAITRLTLRKINDILIPLPPIDEQKEIVKILDKLLEEESKIEELTQLEEQIELIKKSILAKAFRGKLGTHSEEDESALELLSEMLSKIRI